MNNYSIRDERKSARQAAILEVVTQAEVATQNDLAAALRKRGVPATQVSLSRDIAEMGLIKVGGRYKPATADTGAADSELALRTSLKAVKPAGPNLVVLLCDTSAAQPVGLVIDKLAIAGVVGTIAGDDTVFVAVDSAAAGKRLVEFLQSRITKS